MTETKTELPNLELEPKFILQRCPVCNGWGTVSFKRIMCHACKGKGYIAVPALKKDKR